MYLCSVWCCCRTACLLYSGAKRDDADTVSIVMCVATVSVPLVCRSVVHSGWIYDATRSYTWSLVFGGSSLLLSSVLAFILHWRVRQMRQRNRVSTEDAPDHKCVDEDSRLAAAKLQESSTARAESAPQIHLYETSL